ncbi:CCA tRNA nucleotidyltransferase [Henriciella mobilis]|uniref:CCA tRNA nucleotidyltransferase n=2 Tax=Henriciella mobilis TaxID=2305467 RepID=A0A399RAG7_9PROT|nr:CCA tRNA nucleotidyltransferase [Henriciella mobilis]RIJ22053.1 CCA tRNA nucleotidyltransferase [Henriciella mobilis]RIJ26957.1 CCA tRNA nucleotidyltransferase [Henriciella mobilis]
MAALEAVRPGGARFVGGCVRNAIMDRPVDDIDIATQIEPESVIKALEAAGIRAIPTGIDHGTITAVIDGKPFEITTLRRDVETDGRRAVVAFTEDWAEDAGRRDFRLNALYADRDGTVHDPVGGGIEDAEAGRVIFIGDADMRLREDFLRILRFFRFNAWYGAGIDADGLAACARQKEGLKKIAAERIWKELHKLLAAPDPTEAVTAMQDSGVLAIFLPEAETLDGLHDLRVSQTLAGVQADPMLRLMALIHRSANSVLAVSKRLRLSNAEANRLTMWAADNLPDVSGMNGRQLRQALYWHGKQAVVDRALTSGRDVRDLLFAVRAWKRPEFPVGGDDALAAGLKGPEIGQALRKLEEWWMAEDFQPGRDQLLERLGKLS